MTISHGVISSTNFHYRSRLINKRRLVTLISISVVILTGLLSFTNSFNYHEENKYLMNNFRHTRNYPKHL